jgi:hypothetical protein
MNLMISLDEYEQLIYPARERFEVSPGIQAIESTSDDVFLELFLLNFCALGSQMTEPVEGWIRRAAERCAAIGVSELAVALVGHAQAETGHSCSITTLRIGQILERVCKSCLMDNVPTGR